MGGKFSKKIKAPEDSSISSSVQTDADGFKQSLVDTLQESNTARNEMKVVLHEILKQPDTIQEITDIINKVDRNAIRAFWSKFGFAVWSAIVFIAGIGVTILIENSLHK